MLVTKPCESCGFPVRDRDVPNYRPWTCYHCHCLLTGRDPKRALNHLTQMLKIGRLVKREENNGLLSRMIWWAATKYGHYYQWRYGGRPADNWLSNLAMRVRYGLPPWVDGEYNERNEKTP